MKIHQNISLADKNTLRVDARAEWYCEAFTVDALLEAAEFALTHKLKVISLGEGSNIVLADNIAGLVIKNRIPGVTYDAEIVHAASGENWHRLVRSTVSSGLFGLENLALIPGTVGAAPVQNIGAYGVELSDRFISLKAIHLPTLEQKTFGRQSVSSLTGTVCSKEMMNGLSLRSVWRSQRSVNVLPLTPVLFLT